MSSLKQNNYVAQFLLTLRTHRRAFFFVKEHQLWEGFWNYGWVSRFLIFVGVLIGLKFFGIFAKWLNKATHTDSVHLMSITAGMFSDLYNKGIKEIFNGNMHFVMLILLEVIVYHVSRRTLEVFFGNLPDATLKDFVKAQIRVFKVGILAIVLGKIVTVLLSIPLTMIGVWSWMKPGAEWIVQIYFLGFAIVDNYNEQFHLNIKESFKYTLKFSGVSLAIGAVLYLIMSVPIIGPIAGPILAGVTATLVMVDIADLHQTHRGALNHPISEETV